MNETTNLEIGKLYCSNRVNFYLYSEPRLGQYGYVYNEEFIGSFPYIPKCRPFMLLKIVKPTYAQVLYEDKVGWIVGFGDGPDFLGEVRK